MNAALDGLGSGPFETDGSRHPRQMKARGSCRALSLARAKAGPQNCRHGEEGMIKTATLLILGWRLLRSNRWAAVIAWLLPSLDEARLLAKRVHKRWKHPLPALLVSFRAALGPGTILAGWFSRRGWILVAFIALALLSDIFDGVLARRWGTDTEVLRRWDTRADTFFYACVLAAIVVRYPQAVERRWLLLAALVTAEVIQHVFAIVRYGRHASYHSILSKIWGLLLAAATMALLGWGLDNWLLDLAVAFGILCSVQGLAMTLLLPVWRRDVPTLWHAWKLRRNNNDGVTRPAGRGFAPSRAWW
jgi:phosphatidylglycerophosphate synthase